MTRINTNLLSLQARNNLNNNEGSLQTSLQRLSTGLRINSGKDDPSGLIASSVFGSEVVATGQAISNSQAANNIVATADAALSQVSTLLDNIYGLVEASANTGAITASQIAANQVQVDSAIQSIDRIGQTTVFGGDQLLNGSKGFNVTGNLGSVFQSSSDITVNSFNPALHTGSPNSDVSLKVTQSATKATVNVLGDSQGTSGIGLSNLSLDSGTTRATDTLVTNNYSIGSNGSLNDLNTTSTRATRTITEATLATVVADSGSKVDVTITGNRGSKTISGQLLAGATGLDTASNFANLINANSSSTGVTAAVNGGNVVLTSSYVGASAAANVSFANYTGAHSSSVISTTDFNTYVGSGAGSLTFKVTGSVGNANISADASQVAGANGVTYLEGLINAQTGATGVTATVNGSGNIVLTNNAVGTTSPAFISNISATGAGDAAKFTADANQSQFTGAAADATAATANTAVGSLTAGTTGTGHTVFTITGNKGTATVDTAQIGGNDTIINNDGTNSGATALVGLINTQTATTGITASVNSSGNVVLTSDGAGSSSVATITAGNVGSDQTIVSSGHALTSTPGTDGTSNQTTLQVVGDLGRAVITVNNNDVINNSSALVSAINAVTSQTGVTASGSGAGGNVTLTSQNYGSAAQVSISAIAATNASDITLFNAAGTQQTTNGIDVAGTVTTNQGTGNFVGQGAALTYDSSALNLSATTSPSLGQPTAATTTVQGSAGAGAGISNLTAGATDSNTITFKVTGALGSATISGINVSQLQGDSRVLVNAINKVSSQTGVTASTTASGGSYALSNIVLTASTPGAAGSVNIQATAATVAGDVTTFNNGNTFTAAAAGTNAPTNAVADFNVTGGALFQIGPTVNYANEVNVNISALDTNLLGRDVSTTGNYSLHDLLTGGSLTLSGSKLSTASTVVAQAISEIATLRGQLGALQANVLQSNIASQQTALEQVTSAQSTIQDADFAQETANLTRAQVLVQADTSVLAIANQQPQSVLALLPKG